MESTHDPLVLVASADGIGVFGVAPMRAVGHILAGRSVSALAVDAEGWWAILDEHEVWHGTTDGRAEHVATLGAERAHCLLAVHDGPFLGTVGGGLWRLHEGSPTRLSGFDHVKGRASWHAVGLPVHTRSLAEAPDGTLYASVHVGGVLRSDDRGATWHPTRFQVEDDVHEVHAHGGVVYAATAGGLAVSDDAGATWRVERDGLHGTYLRAVTTTPTQVFVSASTGPWDAPGSGAVYRHPLDGGGFERCTVGLPPAIDGNVDTRRLAARGQIVAFGTPTGEVYCSADEGDTWSLAADSLGPVGAVAVAAPAPE